jgi:predicted metalloprotease with PDZ domain
MALKPSSFIRNPVLLFILSVLAVPAAAALFWQFGTCSSSPCGGERADVARAHVEASRTVATHRISMRQVQRPTAAEDARGWLGVRIQTLTPKRAKCAGVEATSGVLVVDTQAKMPARTAGFASHDVITHFDGHRVTTSCALSHRVASSTPGSRVPVRVIRDGVPVTLYPTLATHPEDRR